MDEPLRIYCQGAPQVSGGRPWSTRGSFDWWSPGVLGPQGSDGEQRSAGSSDDQAQDGAPRVDPGEWLRVEAAVVLGTLRPFHPLRAMQVNVQFALLWVDVAARPEVLDLGRVLAAEGAGRASCSWSSVQGREGESACLLTVALQRPVRAAFAIPFSFPDAQRILLGILQAEALVLCFGPPPEGVAEVDARSLYELATRPSRETISIEFDRAAHHDLHSKLLPWAGWSM